MNQTVFFEANQYFNKISLPVYDNDVSKIIIFP